MFPFHKRRSQEQSWLAWPNASVLGNRRALLLSPRQFEREIARERIRSTRRRIPFCVLTLELLAAGAGKLDDTDQQDDSGSSLHPRRRTMILKKQSRKLVDILHRNLRVTDEKGILSAARYGVLLVDTPEMGGRAVMDRLTRLISAAGLTVRLSLQVYDSEGFGANEEEESQSDRSSDHRHDDGHWVRKRSAAIDSSLAVFATKKTLAEKQVSQVFPVSGESLRATNPTRIGEQHGVTSSEMPISTEARYQVSIVSEDSTHRSPRSFRVVKRTLDLLGASTGLVLLGPFLFVAMVAIKWADRGPVFFCQIREGYQGRPFTIYKLRTMIVDAEQAQAALREASHRAGPAFKISNDPRVTKVGHFLRATCLDELPQLINVLKGDMSLVGPRPLPWHESRACLCWHRRRLDVRPGLTCSWQVDKAKAETFDDWMRMDLQYIDQLSLLKDLQLIARTVAVPVTGRGGE